MSHSTQLRHFVVTLSGWLLFGSLITVLLSWISAMCIPLGEARSRPRSGHDIQWLERRGVSTVSQSVTEWRGLGVQSVWIALFDSEQQQQLDAYVRSHEGDGILVMPPSKKVDWAYRFSSGWPCLAVCAWSTSHHHIITTSGIRLTSFPFAPKYLPLIPIFPGFAVNAVLYAGAGALGYHFWKWYRSRQRLRVGLCPLCKFSIQYNCCRYCPECGWRVADDNESAVVKA